MFLGETMQDVEAVDLVPLGDWQVEGDNGQHVRLRNPQRRVQRVDKVRDLTQKCKLDNPRKKMLKTRES